MPCPRVRGGCSRELYVCPLQSVGRRKLESDSCWRKSEPYRLLSHCQLLKGKGAGWQRPSRGRQGRVQAPRQPEASLREVGPKQSQSRWGSASGSRAPGLSREAGRRERHLWWGNLKKHPTRRERASLTHCLGQRTPPYPDQCPPSTVLPAFTSFCPLCSEEDMSQTSMGQGAGERAAGRRKREAPLALSRGKRTF